MKKYILLFLVPIALFGVEGIVFDEYLSPFSGAHNVRYLHRSVREVEDHYLTRENKKRLLYQWGRAGELLLWHQLNMFLSVAQHECFGHGYRLRELELEPIRYVVTPWGGSTQWLGEDKECPREKKGVRDFIGVTIAGLEAEGVLAHEIKMRWMETGKIDGRESTLYTQANHSLFWYTYITAIALHEEEFQEGNDISYYLDELQRENLGGNVTLTKLIRIASYSLLDPMTLFAYYSLWHYIREGKEWVFPTFELTDGVHYLPNARVSYTPFGPEIYSEHYFSVKSTPLYVYVRKGRVTQGVGVEWDRVWDQKKAVLGFRLDGWQQQKEGKPMIGFGGSVKCQTTFRRAFNFFGEIGAKGEGYLPGYSRDRALIVRLGFSFR